MHVIHYEWILYLFFVSTLLKYNIAFCSYIYLFIIIYFLFILFEIIKVLQDVWYKVLPIQFNLNITIIQDEESSFHKQSKSLLEVH